jgi:hypothetical protein
MKRQKESMVEKIIVKYEDGTEKEITKGLVITDDIDEEQDHHLTFEFADMKGDEVANIVFGVMEMGSEMGLFDNLEDEE